MTLYNIVNALTGAVLHVYNDLAQAERLSANINAQQDARHQTTVTTKPRQ